MQNARDTFYTTLRERLAGLNPGRVVEVRGVNRPGVLVEENELVSALEAADVFRLRWTGVRVDSRGTLPLVAMSCEVRYGSDGTAGNGGMDRGRLLAGMDAELQAAAGASPQSAVKKNYAGLAAMSGAAPVEMGTRVFWSDAVFAPVVVKGERVERAATVEVFWLPGSGGAVSAAAMVSPVTRRVRAYLRRWTGWLGCPRSRCGADGRVHAGYAACTVGRPGMVQRLCP